MTFKNIIILSLSVCILALIIYILLSIPIIYADLFQKDIDSNVLFIHIPKTGGNSFIDTFQNIGYVNHHECLKHSYIKHEDKHKVTIVRNPYSRCVSAYSYLKKGGLGGPDIICQLQLSKYNTFKEFAKNLSEVAEGDNAILHLIHQHKFISEDNNILVDKVIKLENINNELKSFCDENNLECPKKLKKKNKSKHKSYKDYYDKETQDLVYNFYKKDFDLLGYSYEL